MKTLEEVRELFAADRFATENGMIIEEMKDHYAKCSVELQERHRNAMGAVMGGTYFTLADFAFAVAANWQTMGTVSLNSTITYLGTAKGNRLTAESVCMKDGRTTACYKIDIFDEFGSLAATVTTMGYHK